MGGDRELPLAGSVVKGRVPDRHMNPSGVKPRPAEASRHAVRQQADARRHLGPGGEVLGEGGAVAHGLHRLRGVAGAHRLPVQPVGVVVDLPPQLAHQLLQRLPGERRQLSDGPDAVLPQQLLRRAPHIEHIPRREGPDKLPPVLPANHGGGVGLFVVAAQLGEDLVEGDPHGEGQTQLLFHPPPEGIRQGRPVHAEEVEGVRHVQPALVDAEGLHQIGVLIVDSVDPPGVLPVEPVVGRQEDQLRAFLPGLPDGLRRPDAEALGGVVLRQDDAVTGRGVPADGHGELFQFRVVQQLHGGVEAVQVTVENDTVHGRPPLRLMPL